jgi:tRNA-dihydrouridine synthase
MRWLTSTTAPHAPTQDHAAHRADWAAIAAVRAALRIPVLANGDVRCLAEARALMEATGAAGVMSAEPLLINPALFNTHEVGRRTHNPDRVTAPASSPGSVLPPLPQQAADTSAVTPACCCAPL